ncbi:ATP-binding protein [Hujiaoplasma nucleasis]|uniref:ATP-binding protein n=1 Tax=Hujiaoplasma nucleasis TaxID=2725268 RepID=A0A7L6N1U7_9MOLU|nr:ATP-binding protein [Hujiaoplasma nucleasis]QLY40143.1 ATP-binding protein [Hujiaoplasma nucleasis]
MVIERNEYLDKIIRHKNNGLIKVITGMRRVGKSYLLFNLYYDYLINNGIDKNHIITYALDDRRNKGLRNPDNLLKAIEEGIKDNEMYYILLDEIQMVDEFEDVLNSLLHMKNTDTYVTGSNSKFLSKDLITEFRGRSDEIRVYPLTFKEFTSVFDGDVNEAWNQYYTYGGLPLILNFTEHEEKSNYLMKQFDKVYISDIVDRYNIRNISELEELVNVLSSSIGSLTNPKKLSNTFKSMKGVSVTEPTIKSYLTYLEDSFLVEKSMRYDVKGKKYISTPSKYYFTDLGLRNGRLNFRQQEENHIMENIIYNELRVRGFNIDVGVVEVREQHEGKSLKKKLEVDFIAQKGNEKYYIQSAYEMSNIEKRKQEEKSLLNISDSFKKVIIVKDNIMPKRDEFGVITIGLYDFLLGKVGLDY